MSDVAQDRREGRGRLSTIDMLPEAAEDDIRWALDQLNANAIPQNLILDQFNARLASRGIKPISSSAFNRWSVRKAIQFRKLNEAREISNAIFASIGTAGADETTMVLAELVKAQIFELVEKGEMSSKDIKAVSGSIRDLATANRASAEHRRRRELEVQERMQKAADAVAEIGAKNGTPKATLDKITELLATGNY